MQAESYLLIAAGPVRSGSRLGKRVAAWRDGASGDARVVCADGGIVNAARLGLVPEVVVGDMDSAPPALLERCAAAGAAVVWAPRQKDETDVELALRLITGEGPAPGRLLLVAPLAGRFDHALQNLLLLPPLAAAGWEVEVADGAQSVLVLAAPGRCTAELSGRPGEVISLLPLSPVVAGIETTGLRYPLRGESLEWGKARGASNELVAMAARVSIASGALAVARGGDRRHRGARSRPPKRADA